MSVFFDYICIPRVAYLRHDERGGYWHQAQAFTDTTRIVANAPNDAALNLFIEYRLVKIVSLAADWTSRPVPLLSGEG